MRRSVDDLSLTRIDAPPTQPAATAAEATVVPAVALVTILLLDILRVWMPSVIFIYGRAGSTPAEQMGAFALVWVVLGIVLAAGAVRAVPPATVLLVAAVGLAAARSVLQLWDGGGDLQLYTASVGWVAAMVALGALAAAAPPGRAVAAGLALGLVADATVRAATGSVELTWIDGLAGTVAGLVLTVAAVVAVALLARPGVLPASRAAAPAWPWLIVGPVFVLYGVLAGTPSRPAVAVGLATWAAAAVTVAGLGLGAAWALSAAALPAAATVVAAGLVLVGTALAAPADSWVAVAGHVLLATGLGGSLGALTATAGSSTPFRRAFAGAGSLALLFLVGFLYYAAYDIPVGIDNRLFLVATAVGIAVIAVAATRRRPVATRLATGPALPAGLATAVLLAAIGAGLGAPAAPSTGDGFPVRVMLYNVHMGFDTAGRFDTAALAEVVAEQDADIVVLNEADRGWFLNGSHDVLDLIARELDMTYVFAPAADEIWGNAVLSRYPLSGTRDLALPGGSVAMERSVIATVADLGGGARLGIVGTHLHHVDGEGDIRRPQAAVVAAEARRLAESGIPVVVMGDMNARPGTDELEPYLDAGLEDAVTPLGDDVRTFPSWEPEKHIDHIFVTSDLRVSQLTVPRSQASDHLGVALTVARR